MEKYFTDIFIDKLPDDKYLALDSICSEFSKFDQEAGQKIQHIEYYFKALAIFKAYASTKDYPISEIQPGNDPNQNIHNIRNFLYQQRAEISKLLHTIYLEQQTQKYTDRFESISAYVFSEDDFTSIQRLINEMRDIITTSEVITDNHKRRLLERLERMQRELHKATSDLDRFWGFIGEAGVAIGKFGNDIKPLVDRINELAKIVWKTIVLKETLLNNHMPISLPDSSNSKGDTDTITT